jgi:hypothetical protein
MLSITGDLKGLSTLSVYQISGFLIRVFLAACGRLQADGISGQKFGFGDFHPIHHVEAAPVVDAEQHLLKGGFLRYVFADAVSHFIFLNRL